MRKFKVNRYFKWQTCEVVANTIEEAIKLVSKEPAEVQKLEVEELQ